MANFANFIWIGLTVTGFTAVFATSAQSQNSCGSMNAPVAGRVCSATMSLKKDRTYNQVCGEGWDKDPVYAHAQSCIDKTHAYNRCVYKYNSWVRECQDNAAKKNGSKRDAGSLKIIDYSKKKPETPVEKNFKQDDQFCNKFAFSQNVKDCKIDCNSSESTEKECNQWKRNLSDWKDKGKSAGSKFSETRAVVKNVMQQKTNFCSDLSNPANRPKCVTACSGVNSDDKDCKMWKKIAAEAPKNRMIVDAMRRAMRGPTEALHNQQSRPGNCPSQSVYTYSRDHGGMVCLSQYGR